MFVDVPVTEAGHFTPVIDRCDPFVQMRKAHRQVELGHKRLSWRAILRFTWVTTPAWKVTMVKVCGSRKCGKQLHVFSFG